MPAAGSGSRLNRSTPKPYLEIGGRTILEHTLRRFLDLKGLERVVIATSTSRIRETREILDRILTDSVIGVVVEGGAERQHSIYCALQEAGDPDLILVHDAVRPFVEPLHIADCCEAAIESDGAVLGIPCRDTIKQTDEAGTITETPSRSGLWQAQTPQVFQRSILMKAYGQAFEDGFVATDDATLVERIGGTITMVEGSMDNFKITWPVDLEMAKLRLEREKG